MMKNKEGRWINILFGVKMGAKLNMHVGIICFYRGAIGSCVSCIREKAREGASRNIGYGKT